MKTARNLDDNNTLIKCAGEIIDKLSNPTLPEVCNPSLQRHYDALEALALEEDINEEVEDELLPSNQLQNIISEQVENFLSLTSSFNTISSKKKTYRIRI